MEVIYYMCDGNVKECSGSASCIKGGNGTCTHTSNIKHAKNFKELNPCGEFVEMKDNRNKANEKEFPEEKQIKGKREGIRVITLILQLIILAGLILQLLLQR